MFKLRALLFLLVLLSISTSVRAAEPVEVVVQGVDGDARTNVEKALALPYGLVQNNRVDTFWLDRFIKQAPDNVRAALEPYGYYHAKVRTHLNKPGENSYTVVVDIDPGPPVLIESVKVVLRGPGRDEPRLRQLAADFPLRSGDVLLQKKYEDEKGPLRFQAVERGYLDADYPRHRIEINPNTMRATMTSKWTRGAVPLGPVRFEGAPNYPLAFLERYLAFKQGEVFSYARLGETQANLVNTERFKQVIPVPEKEQAKNLRVPVLVRVTEAPPKKLRPGIGYATDIGARFSVDYRDLNVAGRGHEFRSELNLSNRLQSFGSSYVVPGKNVKTTTGVLGYAWLEETTTYTIRNITAELNRTAGFGKGRVEHMCRFEREKSTVGLEPVDSRLVLPGVRFSEQRLDNLTRPTRGHQYSIDFRGTDESLGSNNSFVQAVFDGNLLFPSSGGCQSFHA